MEEKTALLGFSALSQPTRLGLLRHLIAAGPDGATAGTLAEEMGAGPSTISFHLKELTRAELVSSRRAGRHIHYMADYAGIRGLIDFILGDCCQGDPRLSGPYIIRVS